MMKLNISKEIYSQHCLEDAVSAYAGYSNIRIAEEEMNWILTFTESKYGEDRTVKEFENYLIGLENT